MHPIQQHTDHPLQALREGGQTLDRISNGAVDNEQHLVHRPTLLELPLNLSQTHLVVYQGLEKKQNKRLKNSLTFLGNTPICLLAEN